MRIGIRTKLFTAFSLIVAYCLAFSVMNGRAAEKFQYSILNILTSVSPAVQNIERVRTDVLLLIESISTTQLLLSLGKTKADPEVASEVAVFLQARQNLEQSASIFVSLSANLDAKAGNVEKIGKMLFEILDQSKAIMNLDVRNDTEKLIELKNDLEEKEERILRETQNLIDAELIEIKAKTGDAIFAAGAAKQHFEIAVITMVIIALINALVLSYLLTKPISDLNNTVKKISTGDFTSRLNLKGTDEIAELGGSFDLMSEKLAATTVSTNYLRGIVDSLNELILVIDDAGLISTANAPFLRLVGLNETGVTGQKLGHFLFPRDNDTSEGGQADLRLADGEKIPVIFNINQLEGFKSESGKKLVVISDQRESLKRQSEINAFRARATQAEKMATLCTLGGILAHKLNQPLTALKLFLQQTVKSLKDVELPESAKTSLEDSVEATEQASKFITEVLSFSKKQNSEPVGDVSLHELVQNVIKALRSDSERAQISIVTEGIKDLPTFKGRKFELEELIFILTQNAIQAAKAGTQNTLTIKGQASHEMVFLTLVDDCGGISQADLNKLLDSFFTTKGGSGGNGIGLHIARQIVRGHGGTFEIEVADGKTTFNISLPRESRGLDHRLWAAEEHI